MTFEKPKEITGIASYKLGLAIEHKKRPDIPNQICPICLKPFTSKWNSASHKYSKYNSRKCVGIANKHNFDKPY